jgi:hypothetical protein
VSNLITPRQAAALLAVETGKAEAATIWGGSP